MPHYVYALCSPGTGEIRYIGKSSCPKDRLLSHMSEHASSAVRSWLREVRYRAELRVLEEHETEESALEAEKLLVEKHWSGRLLNSYSSAGKKFGGNKTLRWSGFGDRLREVRKSRGMTTTRLQEITGIHNGSISKMESRVDTCVTAESAVLLAKALGVSVEYLVTGEQ